MLNNKSTLLFLLLGFFILTTCRKFEKEMMVKTGSATNILTNSADVTGQIIDIGEGATQYGHCYAKTPDVNINNLKTEKGKPTGNVGFTSALSNLEAGTVYYVKAYISKDGVTKYGKEISVNTLQLSLVYFSSVVENATPTLLEMTYNLTLANIVPAASAFTVLVNSVARTVNTVAISGTKVQLTLASPVINGDVVTVAYTKPGSNPLQTPSGGQAASITAQSVTNNVSPPIPVYVSSVVENATPTLLEMTYNLTLANIVPAASAFTVLVNSVARSVNTVAISGTKVQLTLASSVINGNAATVAYTKPGSNPLQTPSGGQAASITAQLVTNNCISVPTITTTTITSITTTTASSGGNITDDGGASVTARGVCWSTSINPTTADNTTFNGTGSGSFVSSMTVLTSNTTYFVRAYATNSVGTAYGNQVSFKTAILLPTLTTDDVSSITTTTATCGGNITSEGGAPVTTRGVCWNIVSSPTVDNAITTDGSGTGAFISSLAGLVRGVTYYVRAYATNNGGTSYGNEVSFTTSIALPTLTSLSISAITATSASGGGYITDDGGAQVTARGVCWSISPNPTTSNSKTNDGSGTGSFVSNLTGLNPDAIYYVRAYATNSVGTIYGNQVSFITNGTVMDIDGNVYNTMTIGTQVWMKENLKTTKYNDGTAIPLVTDNMVWTNLVTPGYCWYNNDATTYKAIYGALYNWFAVSTGKLCLTSWHVPTDAEWTTFENYLIANGYNYDGTTTGNKIAKSIASTYGWTSSTSTGTVGNTDYPAKRNATGFTALPGGYRYNGGTFDNVGNDSDWWSATEFGATSAWHRGMSYSSSNVFRNTYYKEYGFSVRCLRD